MANKLYRVSKKRLDDRRNTGHRYQNTIIKRSIDNHLLKNSTIENMVSRLDVLYNQMINTVKQIKLNRNIYLDEEDFDLIR